MNLGILSSPGIFVTSFRKVILSYFIIRAPEFIPNFEIIFYCDIKDRKSNIFNFFKSLVAKHVSIISCNTRINFNANNH